MTKQDIEMFADSNPNPEEWKQFCMELLFEEAKQHFNAGCTCEKCRQWKMNQSYNIALKETTDELVHVNPNCKGKDCDGTHGEI